MGRSLCSRHCCPPFRPPPGLTDILWHPAIPGVRTPTRCPSLPQAGFHPAPRHRLPRSRVSVARLLRLFCLPVRKVGLSLPRGLCSCCPRSCPSSPRPPAPVESPPRLTSELHGDPLASPTRSRPLATGPRCSPCSRSPLPSGAFTRAALEAPQGAGPGRSVSCGAQRSAQRLTHIVGAKERSGVEEIAPRPLPKHEAPWRMRPRRTGAGWGRRGTWRSARRQGRSEHRGIVSRDVP